MIFYVILAIILILLFIANKFQKKQNKKYQECMKIIQEKGNESISVKNELTKEEIEKKDPTVDVNSLMEKLYEIFLEYISKLKLNDDSINSLILSDKSKLKFVPIIENIELLNYSITEYEPKKLKFRININCKKVDKSTGAIIPIMHEQIVLLSFEKINKKWMISDYEKLYEQILSK